MSKGAKQWQEVLNPLLDLMHAAAGGRIGKIGAGHEDNQLMVLRVVLKSYIDIGEREVLREPTFSPWWKALEIFS